MSELERGKFEKWVRPQLSERDREIVLRWHGAEYQQSWAQMRWEGWLARSESAPLDLRRAWEQGRDAASEIAHQWATSKSCDQHSDNPCCHVRTGAGIFYKIVMLEYPGESAPTTPKVMPKMLDRARQWLEKHVATVESDQVAHFMAGFANDVAGEAGSPAPAPTIECGEGDTLHLLLLNEPGNLKQLVIEFLKWDGGEGSRAYDAHKYFMLREALRDLTALAAPAGKERNNGAQ